jgi:radical SAM protein with 4Fe4S-binding SPASM domain
MQPVPKHYRLRRRFHEAADLGVAGALRWMRQAWQRAPGGMTTAFPDTVSVELTDHCNLACPSCPQPHMTGEKGFMTMDLFRKVVDECCRHPSFTSLVFTGYGEPLLHPDLCAMSRYAKERGVRIVRTYTNAKSLNRDRTDELLLDSAVDEITLSLNGADAESYARIKGSTDFEHVVGNIKHFLGRKRELRRIKPFVNLHLLALTDQDYDVDAFAAEWQPLLGPGDCLASKPSHNFAGQVAGPDYGVLEDGGARSACGQLWSYLFVARAGEVSPCCIDPFQRLALGNAFDSDLEELWGSPALRRMRACHEADSYDELPLCAGCQAWRYFTVDRASPLVRVARLLGRGA